MRTLEDAAAAVPKILLDGVTQRYGNLVVLDDVSLPVRPGEFLTLLGPSGSGKTTILNIICGAQLPSAGRLLMDGQDITHRAARERGLGMVFQNYALLPHMSVFDNIAFPLKIRRWDKARIEEAVRRVLDRVGLAAFAERKPRQLSGGQQQRVGIARCLVYSPSVILMDEPLGALDKKLRDQMQEEIKRLHLELSTTIIYVTHDQEEALNLSDRICLLNKGRIEQLGEPEALYFKPETIFAADFIGESNLIAGILETRDTFRTLSGQAIRLTDSRGLDTNRPATLLVRPEKLMPSTSDDGPNRLSGTVEAVSFVGGMTRVSVMGSDGTRFIYKTVSTTTQLRTQPGTVVNLSWSPDDSILLAV